MSDKLIARIADIPGVASVEVDAADVAAGIRVRLAEGADEAEVLERVRALLVAYGVRSQDQPRLRVGSAPVDRGPQLGVEVGVTPVKGGARVEVRGAKVHSSRVVHPEPLTLVQGVADVWCQVAAKRPVEIVEVTLDDRGELTVVAAHPDLRRVGKAEVSRGWERALVLAVGRALGLVEPDSNANDASLTPATW